MNSAEEFFVLLKQVKQISNGNYMAICPAHNDLNPSLSIKITDEKILLKCLAGCDTDNVVKALHLNMKDLFIRNGHNDGHKSLASHSNRQISKVYPYYDITGTKVLFETVRYIPKNFSQRHSDGNGSYIWNLKGIDTVLYRLPELMQAISKGELIIHVEGEKDVDNLFTLGFYATTSPMGANSWKPKYAEFYSGANLVVLIPDKDEAGRNYTSQVIRDIHTHVKYIKILNLPGENIKDISDWIEAGGTKDQLSKMIETLPFYEPPITPAQSTMEQDEYKFTLTDTGNAERFVSSFGDKLKYCFERKKYLVYNGKYWDWDTGAQVMAMAKETARHIYIEAAKEVDDNYRKEIIKHAKSSESEHRRSAMAVLAQSEKDIPIKISDIDSNHWVFNCLNGTIDLKTGILREHKKEDYLSIIVPINYEATATCNLWHKFLDRVTDGKQELVNYLQRAVGYSLTGDTREQCLFFLYGLGKNGKSTFISITRKLMGEYGTKTNTDLFMTKDRGGGPNEGLADLQGKRFVVASEIEDGRRLAVVLIKEMTGGESIKADRKYEHAFEFQPTHKIWLSGNHRPIITDTTYSIWRRFKLIPFTVTIPEKERDPNLSIKLEQELPGILAWAVKGCLLWQKEGLGEPQLVTNATETYRNEQDILGEFIEDCCSLKSTAVITKNELMKAYIRWCANNNSTPINQRYFRGKIIERGILEGKGTGGVRIWKGVTLNENEITQEVMELPNTSGESGNGGGNIQQIHHTRNISPNFSENPDPNATDATKKPVSATDATLEKKENEPF